MPEAMPKGPSTAELERLRPRLTGHCYRMLGSVFDADDAVQETLVRAWSSRDDFKGRSALSSWVYRIATNVCLDFLAERKRRLRPVEASPAGTAGDELTTRPADEWLEPAPDAALLPVDADPLERAVLRESTRLAFVAALQNLPGKQRAALLLTEVLGFSSQEAADCLELSVAALNSALQRARDKLPRAAAPSEPLDEAQQRLLERYVAAFETFDIQAFTALMAEDAQFSMPPYCLWLSGREEIQRWLERAGSGCRGSRLSPVQAGGCSGFAQYRIDPAGGYVPWALILLELRGARIASVTNFIDKRLFARFGLPERLA